MKDEIIIYQSNELAKRVEVRIDTEKETVWLNQYQLAELFQTDRTSILKHLQNIYSTGELDEKATCAKFAQVRKEGNRMVKREVLNYNLDAILSVGYRVNSKRGTQFRIWANQILKDYLMKGYALNQRMDRIENNVENLSKEIDKISLQIKTAELPTQGVFFDGQIFDAYELAAKIIRSAKKSIVLIDNYIDETTITHLAKKGRNIEAVLLTKNNSRQLELDIKKANEQYGNFTVKTFNKSHDRFLIIDNKEVYHLGASLKDLGKKWFAFSKMDDSWATKILTEL